MVAEISRHIQCSQSHQHDPQAWWACRDTARYKICDVRCSCDGTGGSGALYTFCNCDYVWDNVRFSIVLFTSVHTPVVTRTQTM